MADKTAADRLNELLDRAPKEADYTKPVTTGSGKRAVTKQILDRPAFDTASAKFQSNYGPVIKSLQDQVGLETTQLGEQTARQGLDTEAAKIRAKYLQSPTHAAFSDYAAAPPMAGTLGGYGLARLTTPRALPGASPQSRAALMVGPLAEAALGPVVDAIAHRAQGDNPTERGKDVTGAVGNFGLGESAGASPDEAEAAPAGPRPSEIGPLPSRTEMAMQAASKFPGKLLGAADTASYAHPVIGAARQAYDVIANGEPFLTSPEEAMARENDLAKGRNLEQAQAEDRRQRAELMPKREPIGAEAATATPKNGGISDYRDVGVGGEGRPSAYVPAAKMGFDPADLPEYERGLLEKGIHPAEAAMQLMPHARAGAEAVKRGEDFWGGSDQFERERNALQKFYSMANTQANAVIGKPTGMFDDIQGETP